jgi:hypothetical protein
MKASAVLAPALACLVSASAGTMTQVLADQPAQSLLFMTAKDWQRSVPEGKVALAADFMRIFCVQQAMSPVRLANCLDTEGGDGTPFEEAISCVKKLAETEE